MSQFEVSQVLILTVGETKTLQGDCIENLEHTVTLETSQANTWHFSVPEIMASNYLHAYL